MASKLRVEFRGVIYEVPGELIDGLDRYFRHRIATGSFLRAVLEDRLFDAIGNAGIESLNCLPGLVSYLHMNDDFPCSAYGSPEAVKRWLNEESQEGGTC